MIESGENIATGTTLATQVCIVGTGPAAVTLAWYLLDRGIEVILAEGSRDTAVTGRLNENTLLYNGQSIGQFTRNEPDFLVRPQSTRGQSGPKERERVYGGTSTHWGGQCRPLDPVVFQGRPGFPAWPITSADMDPYYADACSFMQLFGSYYGSDGTPGDNFTAGFWARTLGKATLGLDGFEEAMYQFPLEELLQFQQRKVGGVTIGESPARVILNASLLQIVKAGGVIQHVEVGSMTLDPDAPTPATRFRIKADAYVLACGAVENVRQLLLSDLGGGAVGRFLMGHPIPFGIPDPVTAYLGTGTTPDQLYLLNYNNLDPKEYGIRMVAGRLSPTGAVSAGFARCWFGSNGGYYFELAPEERSCIRLSETGKDLFGQAQAVADWYVGETAKSSYEHMTGLFGASVRALGGGAYVRAAPWPGVLPSLGFNGHHIGTTRMSADPARGVVGADLCVHGIDNLYVAGSSVFTTAGVSNPTFTIIALSIRLAEHLAARAGATRRGVLGDRVLHSAA